MMEFSFDGQNAIVTGAAHGIGRSISVELARRGARVFASDVLDQDLVETVRAVEQAGGRCRSLAADVRDPAEVEELVMAAAAAGGVHILVNCAGGVQGQVHHPIEQVADADWDAIVKVNLYGSFHTIRAAAPHMKTQRYGRIVNISSGAGRTVSLTGIQAYASAKAGQIGLTRQMARELGAWNITVNCIAPGFILSNPTTERQWESYGPEGQRKVLEGISLGRLGRPEDIAHGVVFFASPFADWISGQTLSIDGGSTLI